MRAKVRKMFTASLAIATGLASHVNAISNRPVARRRARAPIILRVCDIEKHFGEVTVKQKNWLELRMKKLEDLRGELLSREATKLVFDYTKKFGEENLSPHLKYLIKTRKKIKVF